MNAVGSAGIPAGAVLDTMELQNDPTFEQRGIMQTIHHPTHGDFKMPAWPVRIDGKPPTLIDVTGARAAHRRGVAVVAGDERRRGGGAGGRGGHLVYRSGWSNPTANPRRRRCWKRCETKQSAPRDRASRRWRLLRCAHNALECSVPSVKVRHRCHASARNRYCPGRSKCWNNRAIIRWARHPRIAEASICVPTGIGHGVQRQLNLRISSAIPVGAHWGRRATICAASRTARATAILCTPPTTPALRDAASKDCDAEAGWPKRTAVQLPGH